MRRRKVILISGFLALAAGGYFVFTPRTLAEVDPNRFNSWEPGTAAIARELQKFDADRLYKAAKSSERLQLFGTLFRDRYRSHGFAVKVSGSSPSHLVLLTPGSAHEWEISHIGLALMRETQANFGVAPSIDIFVTYIGVPPLHAATITPPPRAGERAHVVFTH